MLGKPALPADKAMRRDFYDAEDVQRQYDELPAHIRSQQREIYEAYGFLDMPHAAAQYQAAPESVTRLRYPESGPLDR